MSIKPILFSTPMVQAILEGRKTMTRRVCVPLTINYPGRAYPGETPEEWLRRWNHQPRYQPGDILWVRETWRMQNYGYDPETNTYEGQELQYLADFTDEENACYGRRGGCTPCKWRTSIFMPKSAARIFLRVANVRAERLQDISDTDALAEGVRYWDDVGCCCDSRKYFNYLTQEFDICDTSSGTQTPGYGRTASSARKSPLGGRTRSPPHDRPVAVQRGRCIRCLR